MHHRIGTFLLMLCSIALAKELSTLRARVEHSGLIWDSAFGLRKCVWPLGNKHSKWRVPSFPFCVSSPSPSVYHVSSPSSLHVCAYASSFPLSFCPFCVSSSSSLHHKLIRELKEVFQDLQLFPTYLSNPYELGTIYTWLARARIPSRRPLQAANNSASTYQLYPLSYQNKFEGSFPLC